MTVRGTETPAISAIVVTDTVAPARPLLDALRAQTACELIELMVAAPEHTHEDLRVAAGECFASVVLLAVDPRADGLAAAQVQAIRAAAAPVVVLTETHCFPEPGWAAALIGAHRGPAAAIGPVFLNANAESIVSQAQFVCHYGPFAEPLPQGDWADVPGHNSSYKRAVLMTIDEDLPALFGTEYLLHRRLRELGHELAMEPAARVRHINVSRPRAALREAYIAGKIFATARRRGWPGGRRVLYAIAFPALALVRFRRHARDSRRIGGPHHPQVLVLMVLTLVAASLGEAVGYLWGEGDATSELLDIELRRDRYLRGAVSSERRLIEAISP